MVFNRSEAPNSSGSPTNFIQVGSVVWRKYIQPKIYIQKQKVNNRNASKQNLES